MVVVRPGKVLVMVTVLEGPPGAVVVTVRVVPGIVLQIVSSARSEVSLISPGDCGHDDRGDDPVHISLAIRSPLTPTHSLVQGSTGVDVPQPVVTLMVEVTGEGQVVPAPPQSVQVLRSAMGLALAKTLRPTAAITAERTKPMMKFLSKTYPSLQTSVRREG